ncbi:MAG: metal-dependent transcriptional regulator [Bacteroidetes bacterium]|nr:metal-dependent transcriptional regulator [Bacteroidota bacterium]
MAFSFTEENYIKAIYKLGEMHHDAISTNDIAAKLATRAATVTDMLKRLSDKKLITYQRYHGVKLTEKGRKTALAVIRKHRLWEVFLVEKLKFRWDEVHDIAEQLEHIHSDELIRKLDQFLGKPKFDPHGDPIPDEKGVMRLSSSTRLSDANKKGRYILTGVIDHSTLFLRYLSDLKLKLGDELEVQAINEYDQSYKVMINKKHPEFLSKQVVTNILVQAIK